MERSLACCYLVKGAEKVEGYSRLEGHRRHLWTRGRSIVETPVASSFGDGGCLGPVASGRVVEQGHPPHHETTERTDPQQRAQHPERRDKGSAAPSQ